MNNSNIYDIDGEIIRSIDDNHKMTVEEASEKIEKYRQKLLEVGEKDPKAVIYATYMRNLSQYIMNLYSAMTPEQLNAQLAKAKEDTPKQVKDAIEELQKTLNDDTETSNDTKTEVSGTSTTNNESITDETSRNDETIERTDSDIHENGPVSQSDLLVERAVTDTNMDEYVQFEEA